MMSSGLKPTSTTMGILKKKERKKKRKKEEVLHNRVYCGIKYSTVAIPFFPFCSMAKMIPTCP